VIVMCFLNKFCFKCLSCIRLESEQLLFLQLPVVSFLVHLGSSLLPFQQNQDASSLVLQKKKTQLLSFRKLLFLFSFVLLQLLCAYPQQLVELFLLLLSSLTELIVQLVVSYHDAFWDISPWSHLIPQHQLYQ